MAIQAVCPDETALLSHVLEKTPSREIQTHLEACPRCRTRSAQLQAQVQELRVAVGVTQRGDDGAALTVDWNRAAAGVSSAEFPASIGKYRILGVLAKGGQAIVYRAVDSSLQRDLVIKVVRPPRDPGHHPLAQDVAEEQIVAEGRTLAKLDHANIARVVEIGFHEGSPFLAMQYVHGRTLRQYLADGLLAPGGAARLLAQVARGLAYAHALGIVHQDIKPENIVIDEIGRPQIIDFGLARLWQAWQDEPTSILGGSLWYMAPEQARGQIEAIGPRTDLFGLGAILYEALTGRAPFQGETTKQALELAQACKFDRRAVLARGVPRRLAKVCLKAMAEDPSRRYADGNQLAAALERAARPRRPYRLLLVVAVLAILVGLLSWAKSSRRLPPQYLVRVDPDRRDLAWINQQLPARQGTPCRIDCKVPAGMQAAVFWYDTKGTLQDIPVQQHPGSPGDDYDQLTGLGEDSRFDDAVGMNVVFVCASARSKPTQHEVQAILEQTIGGAPRPEIPSSSLVVLSTDGVRIESSKEKTRGFEHLATKDEVFALEDRFERLRAKLREHFDFAIGVAFRQER
jgi:serine/threonine protein kinase